ncbi:hypothetical protein [Leisingera sp. S232]|uniref:hypothetical protein n=1 Tax=Leisingera sp. S232 TaxID=3415132 RepID=UPI003C7E8110
MKETSPYSRKDLRRAVNCAAILGWLAIVGPALIANPFILPWAAVFGLPIAFATCWAIGAPILLRLMRNAISWLAAGVWGGVIASIIAAISIAIGRYQGWRQSLNPNFNSQIGGGEFVRSVDGILTPYGWWVLAQNTMQFILIGIVIALIVRWRIGQGAQANRRSD